MEVFALAGRDDRRRKPAPVGGQNLPDHLLKCYDPDAEKEWEDAAAKDPFGGRWASSKTVT